MNVLVIGGGGREHALCWKLRQSPSVTRLFAAPGNPGIAREAECIGLDAADHAAVVAFCRAEAIGFVVIGPEAPLVAGLADDLRAAGIPVFGPSAAAARLEGSKGFTKDLCARAGIPTAAYRRFDAAADARAYVGDHPVPVVVKADGLAAGKGVVIAATHAEALAALDAMSGAVVIEEFLEGPEVSLFALCGSGSIVGLTSAQDHKRVGDGDTGPNTGGMGAFSPAPALTPELERRAFREIIRPTLDALDAAGTPFTGVLYAGLMLTATGPKLIEYNVRFGDPECQVMMARLDGDLFDLLHSTATGRSPSDVRWIPDAAVAVVLAANGYPGSPRTGTPIAGIEAAEASGAHVFHAGTARDALGRLAAAGGRVLAVTATGHDLEAARTAAYAAVDRIDWPGGFHRRDIGRASGERP